MPALEIVTIVFLAAVGTFIGGKYAEAGLGVRHPQPYAVTSGLTVPHHKRKTAPVYSGNWTGAGKVQ